MACPLQNIFYHLFLPSYLPSGDDPGHWVPTLVKILKSTLSEFSDLVDADAKTSVHRARDSILNFETIRLGSGQVSSERLNELLSRVAHIDGLIPVHAAEQNAGVIIRSEGSNVFFEIFELSPTNNAVYSTPGRLRRFFPQEAVATCFADADQASCHTAIATTLATMSNEPVADMQPRVKKSGTEQIEARDTTSPYVATHLFVAVLLGLGGWQESVSGFWKNTREEVRWKDGNMLPWHRSPVWLLLRITLQRALTVSGNGTKDTDNGLYKRYMAFFMSKVLKQGIDDNMSSQDLVVMSTKVGCRLLKIDCRESEPWLGPVQAIIGQAQKVLKDRWIGIIEDDTKLLDITEISADARKQGTQERIPSLDAYLEAIGNRSCNSTSSFTPPAMSVGILANDALPISFTSGITSSDPHRFHKLALFEAWVKDNLNPWLASKIADSGTCGNIRTTMANYHSAASVVYKSHPEGMSIMFLTVIELWIACDKSGIHHCPMMADYAPGVPVEPLRSLLLKSSEEMKRLHNAETYILDRKMRSKLPNSILFSFGSSKDFGVRFFDSSPLHQELLDKINHEANRRKEEKRQELRKLKKNRQDLLDLYNTKPCDYISGQDEHGDPYTHHSTSCKRCSYLNKANDMTIDTHEWPLPEETIKAKAVVFELQVPGYFQKWRDTTLHVIKDVLGYKSTSPQPNWYLQLGRYSELATFNREDSLASISLMTEVKPHGSTHRKSSPVSTAEDSDVLLDHGPCWMPTDLPVRTALKPLLPSLHTTEACSLSVPDKSAMLVHFMKRPWSQPDGCAPNEVIASQSICPEHFHIGEFKALCSLPLGEQTAWLNLLVQLNEHQVSFNKAETLIFVWQLVEQCGSVSTQEWRRITHQRAADAHFVHRCLEGLSHSLMRCKESWEMLLAVATYTLIAQRLLALGPAETSTGCLDFLGQCRRVSCQWQRELRQKASNSQESEARFDLSRWADEAALVCLCTFHVEPEHLPSLMDEPTTVAMYLECIMTRCEVSFVRDAQKTALSQLSFRCDRLVDRLCPIIEASILREPSSLDLAIQATWAGFQRFPFRIWETVARQWFRTIVSPEITGAVAAAEVHFNVVSGELLVNGFPRARLPSDYESHEVYKLLFGHCALDVFPIQGEGTSFTASEPFNGFQLSLGLDKSTADLVVCARTDQYAWELLPTRIFQGILPCRFTESYVYWLNIESQSISLCPVQTPWPTHTAPWIMEMSDGMWHVTDGAGTLLLFPSKPTTSRLASIFNPLETNLGLNVYLDSLTDTLSIEIPRLDLEFFIKPRSDKIYSSQYTGMYVDKTQGIGTLIGLESKLVLRSPDDALLSRVVLVPDFTPSMALHSNGKSDLRYPKVTIAEDACSIQAFRLDRHLGVLNGSGSLRSRLFLAELHAMTSGLLGDPFTGITGTESALQILASPAVRSLDIFDEEAQILHRISALSPSRSFYPTYLQEMQVVHWNGVMSPLTQSDAFAVHACAIYGDAQEMECFPERKLPDIEFSQNGPGLTQRGLLRSLGIYDGDILDSGNFSVADDKVYHRSSHDAENLQIRTHRAARFGSAMRLGQGILPRQTPAGFSPGHFLRHITSWHQPTHTGYVLRQSELAYGASLVDEFLSSTLHEQWCSLHRVLPGQVVACGSGRLVPWIAALAFSKKCDRDCLQAFLAFAHCIRMSDIQIPPKPSYSLDEGCTYKSGTILTSILNCKQGFYGSLESTWSNVQGESNRAAKARRQREFHKRIRKEADALETLVRRQWPSRDPDIEVSAQSFQAQQVTATIRKHMTTWCDNADFYLYLDTICKVLDTWSTIESDVPLQPFNPPPPQPPAPTTRNVTLLDLVNRVGQLPILDHEGSGTSEEPELMSSTHDDGPQPNSLGGLVQSLLGTVNSQQEMLYLKDLAISSRALQSRARGIKVQFVDLENLRKRLSESRVACDDALRQIRDLLCSQHSTESFQSWKLPSQTPLWPRVTAREVLRLLSIRYWSHVPDPWKKVIVNFGVRLSHLQALERLWRARGSMQDVSRDRHGLDARLWDPMQDPDSLALEIEGDLRIRPVQSEIAADMSNPPEGRSAVMQLSMGEGKSSVIVPKVAATLADGTRLVRVIVAKPQSRQMLETLVSKLGGLLNRQVYQMPMSRSVKLDESQARILHRRYQRCIDTGGVMLIQQEHILSFQLMTIESRLRGDTQLCKSLWDLRSFFESKGRDIVDESDEVFSTKFELVYTIGDQRSIEYCPDRWTMAQEVLEIVADICSRAKVDYPKGIEVDRGQNAFPVIRFLTDEATKHVLQEAVDHICLYGLKGFPIWRQGRELVKHLRSYIADYQPEKDASVSVEKSDFWTKQKDGLLFLRGLFAGGILEFALGQKRWRVHYGLDGSRVPSTQLAVPYRAKDCPSSRSEFSHPDVVIILTCLSYYYGGLECTNMQVCLEHLVRSDQKDTEYRSWVTSSYGLPESLRDASGINLRDREQFANSIFPSFRFSKGAVNYFLSHFVFPREMKEFPHKLSASGWDLAAPGPHPLTGFSGTNDSQHTLPTMVRQLPLEAQAHTNSMVLEYVLRPENSVISLSDKGLKGVCKSCDLLRLVTSMEDPKIRVVLDVGAQILDMTNVEFAGEWLQATKGDSSIEAVVFCSANDDKCVIDRRGKQELLSNSPFARQLDRCAVFLDEAHTRGIDLQLPSDYSAAVTLGANLTKDRLVQACMRMRKLGHGQSVHFFVPEEIESKILQGFPARAMTVQDVLEWAVKGTWRDLRRSMPLWLTQGKVFARQKFLWDHATSSGGEALFDGSVAKEFLQDEAQSLERRYRPQDRHDASIVYADTDTEADKDILSDIAGRCHLWGDMDTSAATLQEEQERELAPEIEQERQLERPAQAEPEVHSVHKDIRAFVSTGQLRSDPGQGAYMLAFDIFRETTAALLMDLGSFPRTLLATTDFQKTVKCSETTSRTMDDYLRLVQWVLTDGQRDGDITTMMILSPHEANELIPDIQASKHVTLRLFAPQVNQTFPPLDHLSLYTVPSCANHQEMPTRLRMELMLFSGQLYLSSMEQYAQMCDFLCLAHGDMPTTGVMSDGFIHPDHHNETRDPATIIRQSPVHFLQAIFTRIIRAGEGIDKTHMGRILEGGRLQEKDFEVDRV